VDVKVGKVEAKVRKDKKASIKLLVTPVPAKKVKFEENKKKPPARDNICIGDLLNHYGANQQIACQSPCKYIHYIAARHDQAIHFAAVSGSGTTVSFDRCNHRLCDDTKFK